MGIVIGKDHTFYEIPDEVLATHVMPEEKVKKAKAILERTSVKVEAPDVEGQSYYVTPEEELVNINQNHRNFFDWLFGFNF